MGMSGALSSAAAAACSAFTDNTKFKSKALFPPNPRRNCCCYSIITPNCTATAASTSSSSSPSAASSIGSNNSATMVTQDEEEEAKKKIGAKVRVKVPVKVYHVARVAEELDLCGLEGEVKQYVNQWKGRRVSANLPYKIQFVLSGGVKFFAHLREDELEFLD
ncbi:FERREDOXIN-THIOREDOXIN REDUCTASE VARIABLE CHAIN [Salix viminalis]|uniref:FERREDOXIN-THIOREDOXIN REDUCTASE VARIABLE CHAIN n=1 Tax=Salix viminalis TaxID=40686 RepID=A0A9Q0TY75_SALVM|nr:FERREDOXIN-THIOREDOXIN REDUCTASE VARIABLE CHAIN [Salix viminalis]